VAVSGIAAFNLAGDRSMQYFAYALAVWSVLALCGLPLAGILLPQELRRLALPAAPLLGYAYIVFVAYHIFRMNIGGTNLYAPYLLLPPLAAFLVPAVRRRLALTILCDRDALLMVAFAAASFLTTSTVFLLARGRAVAMALSNLDIVEYACDARYLQEFARNTTIGFMGQSHWFMHAGDAFWFGPSLIAAVMSTLIFSEPFRLQSIVIGVIACQGAAFVYAIARDSLSLERPAASVLALLYALSPIVAFTVWQGFGAQTASMALMLAIVHLMTLAESGPPEIRLQARYLPAIVLLSSAMLVTYHFMVAVVAALLGCYILALALAERSPRRLAAGALLLAAAMLATALLNPLRMTAALGTLSVLREFIPGWFLPWLGPDAQLGFNVYAKFIGGDLQIGARWSQGLTFLLTLALGLHLVRRRGPPHHLAFVFGLAFPALMRGFYYAADEAQGGVLGGYRSYKITSTFLAFTLLAYGLCFGVSRVRWRRTMMAVGAALSAALVVIAASNLREIVSFANGEIFVPPEELTKLRGIEAMDPVGGIDVMDDGNFELFWILYFTLRKPQIFARFPYNDRVVAAFNEPYRLGRDPLVGLVGGGDIFEVESAGCDELVRVTSRYSLCRAKPNPDVTVTADKGWWEPERFLRWSGRSGRNADVIIDNRLPGLRARIKALYGRLRPGDALALQVNGEPVPIEESGSALVSAPVVLTPGRNLVRFTTRLEPMPPVPFHDDRPLGVMWRRISIEFPDRPAE
jgi:hypothetical protein